jgi:hypothetical protein
MGEKRGMHAGFWWEGQEGKYHYEYLDIKWLDNIKMDHI